MSTGKFRKTTQIKVRADAAMHRDLARAAQKHGATLSTEIITRLSRSFREEEMWGAARHAIFTWASAFVYAGEQEAQMREIEKKQWTTDRACFDAAWLAASEAVLAASTPDLSKREELAQRLCELAQRLYSRVKSQQLTAKMHQRDAAAAEAEATKRSAS